MKILITILSLFVFHFCSFSQSDTVYFEDGNKIAFELLYDDPIKMPVWEININPLSFQVASGQGALVLSLEPKYKINDKAYADFNLKIPYSKRVDESRSEYRADIQKMTIDFTPLVHYQIGYKEKTKKKGITLKRVPGYDGYTAYRVEHDRIYGRTFYFDGGLNYLQTNLSNLTHSASETEVDHNNVNLSNYGATSVSIGITTTKSESYSFKANGEEFMNWNRVKIYARLNYSILTNFETYEVTSGYDAMGDMTVNYESTEAYNEDFSINNIGYRAGLDLTLGLYSKRVPFNFGFETGRTPTFETTNSNSTINISSPTYFSFHLGFGIVQF